MLMEKMLDSSRDVQKSCINILKRGLVPVCVKTHLGFFYSLHLSKWRQEINKPCGLVFSFKRFAVKVKLSFFVRSRLITWLCEYDWILKSLLLIFVTNLNICSLSICCLVFAWSSATTGKLCCELNLFVGNFHIV